jgi:pimeloyl-ACP methyl ester carboxylesterase
MPLELLRPRPVEIARGRRLNFHCVGTGSPTVVFEQGGEGFLTNWKKVQPAATALTRTCFYDRAGFGYSDPPDKPVTGLNVTDDLRALLKRAKVTDRVVLVGHSIGGFYATLYADRFPEQVAGLVLVDPGFAGQVRVLSAEQQQRRQANGRRGEGYLLHCAEMARAGKLTPENLTANNCVPVWPGSTPEERPYLLHAILRPHWHLAEHSQSVHYHPGDGGPSVSWRQEMEARRSFGDTPMAVLSAGVYPTEPWDTEEEGRAAQAHWQEGHRQLAARSTRGRWSVVPGAGHFIQTEKPEAVVAALREVVAQVRRDGLAPPRSR